MIFRLSQKLAKKIRVSPSQCLPHDENPFADWSAHLFRADRVQYVILTNTASLYSIVTHGRGIADDDQFIRKTLSSIREFMKDDGNELLFEKYIEPGSMEISFSKSGDRKVLGSMNDLILHAKLCLTEREMSPFEASLHLNEMPMSYLGYSNPGNAFRALSIGGQKMSNGSSHETRKPVGKIALVPRPNVDKDTRRTLAKLAELAREREERAYLGELAQRFDEWREGKIDNWDLNDAIHKYHQGPSQEVYVRYRDLKPDYLVPLAVACGFLEPADIPEDLREAIVQKADAISAAF